MLGLGLDALGLGSRRSLLGSFLSWKVVLGPLPSDMAQPITFPTLHTPSRNP